MERQICRTAIFVLLVMVIASWTVVAQEQPRVFSLPVAYASEAYRTNAEDVLRDKYGLKLESGARTAIIQWYPEGELPPGISLRTDGTIIGTPTSSRDGGYRFRLKIVDVSVKNEELLVDFTLPVKPGRLRLTKIEGPRLVPVVSTDESSKGSVSSSSADEVSLSRESKSSSTARNGASTVLSNSPDQPTNNQNSSNADQKDLNNPFSSLNKRFILGFEQTGAASSDSTGSPFFDIFINTPLSRNDSPCNPELAANFKADKSKPPARPKADNATTTANPKAETQAPCLPPRFSVWGDVRLTSTPQQVTALGAVAANSVGTITDAKSNQIASAFDFVVGPEVRLQRFHHTDLSLIAGFGAVSPISPKQSAQIFQVPVDGSSQRAAFLNQYPGAKSSKYIAFITPDRDRFFRQYFGGFRFKTFNYETDKDKDGNVVLDGKGNPKEHLVDAFPATFDITFGQNESVTGGRLHKFVVGLDGFYPLPFPDKNRFLYLFGSARFKAGGPKSIGTPFILDTAGSDVKITDTSVFIADPVATNRDTYRIGFGVDLVELFKFAQAKGKQDAQAAGTKPAGSK